MLKALAASAAGLLIAASASAQQRPIAPTTNGRVIGTAADGVAVFRGVPYAAAPIGARRWRPPVDAVAWTGLRDASRFGSACAQPPGRTEAWAQVGPTSEDCLFLNVWRPTRRGSYPVMVFLHGGGFTYGAAGVPLYDGANLARRGVVVVTLNYRLGVLGFFAHPTLTQEASGAPLGNYGIMDQLSALRWVRRNIAGFGGDARNVTVFGESAGAGSIQLMMGSPAADGLFDRAVSQSGAGGSVLPSFRTAEATGRKLTDAAGLGEVTAVQLRGLPVEKLLLRSFPFIDGRIVVASPGTAFQRRRQAKVPLIIGANSNEATLSANNAAAVKLVLGEQVAEFERAYAVARPRSSADAARIDLAEDVLSVLPSISIGTMHAAAGAPAYGYYFTQVPASQRVGSAGAGHGDEVQYLFGNPYDGAVWDANDRAVSQAMGDHWVRFARTGNPNGAGASNWPRIDDGPLPRYLSMGQPTRALTLTPLEERVRAASLAASASGWEKER